MQTIIQGAAVVAVLAVQQPAVGGPSDDQLGFSTGYKHAADLVNQIGPVEWDNDEEPGDPTIALLDHYSDAADQGLVTREYYRGYRRGLREVCQDMKRRHRDYASHSLLRAAGVRLPEWVEP